MPTDKAMLVTHPVRARILTALLGRNLTTQQIASLLSDVPLPSVYRHVRLLAEGGAISAVDEARVNGALTKVYGVRPGQANVTPADMEGATRAEHFGQFTTFLNSLAELYRAHLRTDEADLPPHAIQAYMTPLRLTPEECQEFSAGLGQFLSSWMDRPATEGSRRFVFAHIFLPDQPDPPLE